MIEQRKSIHIYNEDVELLEDALYRLKKEAKRKVTSKELFEFLIREILNKVTAENGKLEEKL